MQNPEPSLEAALPQAGPSSRLRPWDSLAFRDYRLFWGTLLLGGAGVHMRQMANLWQVYALTGSPLQLGLTGLFQGLPLVVFGVFGGTLADLVDRRRLMIFTQIINLVLAVVLTVLTFADLIQVWHIYLITMMTSAVNVVDRAARMALIPSLVPRSHIFNAVSLHTSLQQVTSMAGPSIAGVVLAWQGTGMAYLLNGCGFLVVVFGLTLIKTTPRAVTRTKVYPSMVLEGMRFILTTSALLAFLLLDIMVNLFSSYRVLLPIFAEEILHVGPIGFGLLSSAPAFGAFLGTATVTAIGDIARPGRIVLLATLGYAGAIALFGASTWFWASLLLIAVVSFTDSFGVVLRHTTLQILVPDEIRGRATSAGGIFTMGGPSFGGSIMGFISALIGVQRAMVLGGAVCAVTVLVIGLGWRLIWSFQMPQSGREAKA